MSAKHGTVDYIFRSTLTARHFCRSPDCCVETTASAHLLVSQERAEQQKSKYCTGNACLILLAYLQAVGSSY